MKLEQLERKAKTLGTLIGLPNLRIGMMYRKYRVENWDNGEDAFLCRAYLSAQKLWDRMDYAETAVRELYKNMKKMIDSDIFK